MKRTCVVCGKEFDKRPCRVISEGGRYCSNTCKGKAMRVPKIQKVCELCGKQFEVHPCYSNQKYCSRACRNIMTSRRTGENHPNHVDKVKRICKTCGKEFLTYQKVIDKGMGIYCSCSCRASRVKSKEEIDKINSRRVRCVCKTCNKVFYIHPSLYRKGQGKHCSIECNSGSNNSNWNGGYSKKEYCEKWTVEFRRRIRLFFNNTCVECGTPQNGKLLHCHHVYYDKKACCAVNENGIYLSNLGIKDAPHTFEIIGDPNKFVALCDGCHSKTSVKKNRWRWARYYEEIINSYYDGKSYLTKEEYDALAGKQRASS